MDQDTYWNQWLEGIGAYIDVMHIKDYSLGKDRAYQPEQLGEGILGYKEISRWLMKINRICICSGRK